MVLTTLDDWINLINELGIVDEYGTYLNGSHVLGNMDLFARDMRAERRPLFR